jgi:hypothetical protein
MWAEAIFLKADLEEVTGELFPLRIVLGEGGNGGTMVLTDRRELALLAGVGLRMTITAEIHWPVLGVHVPVSIRAATLEIRPEIVEKPAGPSLAFRLRLDEIDVAAFPVAVDRGIVGIVNRELEAKHVELAWGFTKTLSHSFDLPDALASAGPLDLCAVSGRVKVTSEAIALAVLFRARVEPRSMRTDSQNEKNAPEALPRPAEPRRLFGSSPAALGALGALAMVLGAGLHALVARGVRRRPRFGPLHGLAS